MAEKKEKKQPKAKSQEEIKAKETAKEEKEPQVDVLIEDDELQKLQQELEKQKELALRTAAEFDNFKKRTERDRAASFEFMKADIVKSFLPVLDNFDRALQADPDGDDFKKGIEMISNQLTDVMVKLGLSEIGGEGEDFDPQLHQAVMHTEDENFGENTVVKVLQKGYKIGDTVVRPAMVQVAN